MPEPQEKPETRPVDYEANLVNIVSFLNSMAMDVSFEPKIRRRALTAAENSEFILASVRKTKRQALRSELKPAQGPAK